MESLASQLKQIKLEMENQIERSSLIDSAEVARKTIERAIELGLAASGSWRGHHASVYFKDFNPVPAGKSYLHFRKKPEDPIRALASLMPIEPQYDSRASTSRDENWGHYSTESIKRSIFGETLEACFESATGIAKECEQLFDAKKDNVVSLCSLAARLYDDLLLNNLAEDIAWDDIASRADIIEAEQSKHENPRIKSNRIADNEVRTPPHIEVYATAQWVLDSITKLNRLHAKTETALRHLTGLHELPVTDQQNVAKYGEKIFIGHGQSDAWKKLRSHLQDILELPVDEFNQSSAAGKITFHRLLEMVDDAGIAFLVMTGEDKLADGKLHPRLNVVHEAGLFQYKLGNERAIVLLEKGCERFSNIEGITYIEFPKGKIQVAFAEIEETLEREGLLKTNT